MKKFTFRLQVVLDRALDEEEKQQQLLAKLRNELLAKEREISDVNCKREQTMGLVMHMQDGAFEAHQMHAAYLHLEGLGNDLADLATQRREIDGRVGAKQREVIEAMRKRQVLEKLREKQL
ncbi:MAG TPA: hypothetical protein VHV83_08905, partial [Armatimonadota bacterium]|nr:hypothetical protein [Armatimonadota bacterium]